MRNLGTGQYRWRVRAWEKSATVPLVESAWRNVGVYRGEALVTESPAPGEGIYYWKEPKSFEFKWKAGDATRYRLELAGILALNKEW